MRNPCCNHLSSLGTHEGLKIPHVPLKNTSREAGHEGAVERVGLRSTSQGHSPHEVPDVKVHEETGPSAEQLLEFGRASL